jgi:hypothetical protein
MKKGDYRWSIETEMQSKPMFRFVLEWMRSSKAGDMICAGPWRKRRGIAMRDLNVMRNRCLPASGLGIIAED